MSLPPPSSPGAEPPQARWTITMGHTPQAARLGYRSANPYCRSLLGHAFAGTCGSAVATHELAVANGHLCPHGRFSAQIAYL